MQENAEQSSAAIKGMIRELIRQENKKKPYSDAVITKLLNEKGIQISRRTVAKYRDQEMCIRDRKSIIYKEQGILTVLVAGHFEAWVKECVGDMCENDENIYAGIGITVNKLNEIHRSFESAPVSYTHLDVYKRQSIISSWTSIGR